LTATELGSVETRLEIDGHAPAGLTATELGSVETRLEIDGHAPAGLTATELGSVETRLDTTRTADERHNQIANSSATA